MSETGLDTNFEITTSLRWNAAPSNAPERYPLTHLLELDGIPLQYHRDRLLAAAEAFGWPTVISLLSGAAGLAHLRTSLLSFSATLPQPAGTYKLRLAISITGSTTITSSDPIVDSIFPFVLPQSFPSAFPSSNTTHPVVRVAPRPTTPSLFTTHKTTNRRVYEQATSSLPFHLTSSPPTVSETLLYNPSNQIMECVYSTPYFLRDQTVVTPAASSGGNQGVTRRLALEKGWCVEGIVDKDSVRDGEFVVLSNAVRGFWAARVSLSTERKRD